MTITIDCPSAKQAFPIGTLVAGIQSGQARCADQVDSLMSRAHAARHLNPIAWVDWDRVRHEAQAIDISPRRGALAGVPVSIKDLYQVDGMPMTAGTRAELPELASRQALAVSRLRQAGALIFAKTQMHEIALGATGENEWTGDVCNPVDPSRQAGGSSSGAAVCVASGIGLAGLGSDTGGSVRIPASFCGVTGFKPSFGAIALDGALPLSWTCDHAGPIAGTVDDCARLFAVLSAQESVASAPARMPRLGVPAAWLQGRLEAGVREAFDSSCRRLSAAGVTLVEPPLAQLPQAIDYYTTIVRAEAAWVHRKALAAGGQGFSAGVLAPLKAGQALPASDYIGALQARAALCAEFDRGLAGIDALILPSTAIVPPPRGMQSVSVEGGQLSVREAVLGQTLPFSLCALPALSIPWVRINGLPVGWQLVGRRGQDALLLELGRWFERRFGDWASNAI